MVQPTAQPAGTQSQAETSGLRQPGMRGFPAGTERCWDGVWYEKRADGHWYKIPKGTRDLASSADATSTKEVKEAATGFLHKAWNTIAKGVEKIRGGIGVVASFLTSIPHIGKHIGTAAKFVGESQANTYRAMGKTLTAFKVYRRAKELQQAEDAGKPITQEEQEFVAQTKHALAKGLYYTVMGVADFGTMGALSVTTELARRLFKAPPPVTALPLNQQRFILNLGGLTKAMRWLFKAQQTSAKQLLAAELYQDFVHAVMNLHHDLGNSGESDAPSSTT